MYVYAQYNLIGMYSANTLLLHSCVVKENKIIAQELSPFGIFKPFLHRCTQPKNKFVTRNSYSKERSNHIDILKRCVIARITAKITYVPFINSNS